MTYRDGIIQYLKTVQSATLQDIITNCEIVYYCNTQKYVGEMMSRLVNSGVVNRIKKGTFEINRTGKHQSKVIEHDKNQMELL